MTTPVGTATIRVVGDISELARSLQGANLSTSITQSLRVDDSALRNASGDIGRDIARAIAEELKQQLQTQLRSNVGDATRDAGRGAAPDAHRAGEQIGQQVADGAKEGSKGIGAGISDNLGKLAALGGGLAVAGTLTKIFTTGADEEKDYETGLANLNTLITNTGGAAGVTTDQLEAQASAIQNATGQTDDSIVAAQTFLLKQGQIKNAVGDGNDVLTRATQLSADIAAVQGGDASASAAKLAKALENPATGYKALSKAGLDLTDQQKAQIKAFQASGDTLGAQKIILGQLESQYKGAAVAQGNTIEGQKNKATRAFEDFSQGVYAAFLPVLNAILPALTSLLHIAADVLGPVLTGVADVLEPVGKGIASLFSGLADGGGAVAGIGKSFGGLSSIFSGLKFVLSDVLGAVQYVLGGGGAADSAQTPLGIAAGFLAQVFLTVKGIVLDVAGQVLPALQRGFALVVPFVERLAMQLLPLLIDGAQFVADGFATIAGVIRSTLAVALPLVQRLLASLLPIIERLVQQIIPALQRGLAVAGQAFRAVASAVQEAVAKLLPKLEELYERAAPAIARVISALVPVFNTVVSVIKFLIPIVREIASILIDVLGFAISAIIPIVVFLINTIANVISVFSAVLSAIVSVATFIGTVFIAAVSGIGDAFSAIPRYIQMAADFFLSLPGKVLSALGDLGSYLLQKGKDLVQGLLNGISGFVTGTLIPAIEGLPARILSGLENIGDLLLQKGKDLVQGLIDGIEAKAEDAVNAIGNLASKLASKATFGVLDFGSPSRLMRKYGGWISQGLGMGITEGAPGAVAAAGTLSNRVAGAVTAGMGSAGQVPSQRRGGSGGGAGGYGGPSADAIGASVGRAVAGALDNAGVKTTVGATGGQLE